MQVISKDNWNYEVLDVPLVQSKLFAEVSDTFFLYFAWENVFYYSQGWKILQSVLMVAEQPSGFVYILCKFEKETLGSVFRQSIVVDRLKEGRFCGVHAKLIFVRTCEHLPEVNSVFLDLILKIGVIQKLHPLFFDSTKADDLFINLFPSLFLIINFRRLNHGDIEVEILCSPSHIGNFLVDKIGKHGCICAVSVDCDVIGVIIRVAEFPSCGEVYIKRRMGMPKRMIPIVTR